MSIKSFFASDGPLAKQFDNYEPRAEQVAMAEAVAKAIEEKKNLAVEAGTGVGKSLGYLVPILKAIEANPTVSREDPLTGEITTRPARVVIATNTKNLQMQLIKKELPMLQKVLPWMKFAMAVGSENFVCLRRMNRALAETEALPGMDTSAIPEISKWTAKSDTGMRMDFGKTVAHSEWSSINRQSDICMGKKSAFYGECFYRKAKRELEKANVIVANHHLLMAHITLEFGGALPEYDWLVVDEFHSLENVAQDFFGVEVSSSQIERFIKDAKRIIRSAGDQIMRADEIREMLDEVGTGSEKLFTNLKLRLGQKDAIRLLKPIITASDLSQIELIDRLAKISDWINDAVEEGESGERTFEVKSLADRAKKLSDGIRTWLLQEESDHVYQIISEAHGKRIVAKSSPIDLAPHLRQTLFNSVPVIGTSATISTGGNMKFIKGKLGAESADELVLNSPFDYGKQAMIYIPADLPAPKPGIDPAYYNAMVGRIVELLKISQGRAMILCTSIQSMNTLGGRLKSALPELNFLIQGGEVERHHMIDELKRNPNTVLIGVNSLWQGVDVQGSALQMVIIIKMPFPNVGDPLFEARCERIDSQSSNPRARKSFMTLSLPEAIIRLKQGFGRLIRSSNDWGCVAIMDTRVVFKGYGKTVLRSLPPTPIKYTLGDVELFFRHRTTAPSTPPAPPAESEDLDEVPF